MTDSASVLESKSKLDGQQADALRAALRVALSWDVEHRPGPANNFPAVITAMRKSARELESQVAGLSVEELQRQLRDETHGHNSRTGALLELKENGRLVRTATITVAGLSKDVADLPRVLNTVQPSGQNEEPRAAGLAAAYLEALQFQLSTASLDTFLRDFQASEPLHVDELLSIPVFLQFAALRALLKDAKSLLENQGAEDLIAQTALRVWSEIKCLRTIGVSDWASLLEPLILIDSALSQDPAQAYGSMDFESRAQYRKRVAFLSRFSDHSESHVAQVALTLAQEAAKKTYDDQRLRQRLIHVGYYLVDDGFKELGEKVSFHPRQLATGDR